MSECVEMFRKRAENSQILLTYFIPENLKLTVISDRRRLKQVLLNLLSNAFKFTEIGLIKIGVRKGIGNYYLIQV